MRRLYEQADGRGRPSRKHRSLKRLKARVERRAAKLDPECQPFYRRFWGYEL